jgi:hypothetical protein
MTPNRAARPNNKHQTKILYQNLAELLKAREYIRKPAIFFEALSNFFT